jgi:hypothetical protein
MSDATALTAPPAERTSYAARAFSLQYNLILLGGAALFSLAAASPWPLAVGLGAELAWLLVGSNLGAVRRWLDRREVFAEVVPAVAAQPVSPEPALPEPPPPVALEREYQQRLATLERVLGELRSLAGPRADPIYRRAVERLEIIRASFCATCEAHQGIVHFMAATPEADLTREVEQLQQTILAEKDLTIKLTLRQALVLAKRRIEQRQAMSAELGALALKLGTVERAVAHLFTQGRALGGTAKLAAEIDAVVVTLGA